MPNPKTQPDALRLHADHDADRQVVVHPKDDDLFVLTGRQAIQACQLGISIELWLNEFESMLRHVEGWASEHADKVVECFAMPRDARVVLFVIPSSPHYDFDLADELVELNTHLMKAFNIGMVELHQVPEAEVERFLDPSHAKRIYGRPGEARPAVEA
ncbi:MAG: hypothetical protein WBD40_12080 [Tepidisphaeraceae bacterium]